MRVPLALSFVLLTAVACSGEDNSQNPDPDGGTTGPFGGSGGSGGGPFGGSGGDGAGASGGSSGAPVGGSSGGPSGGSSGGPSGGSSGAHADSGADAAPPEGVGLSAQYPGDVGIANDPSVIFHSDFEADLAGWTRHTRDAELLGVDSEPGIAHGGSKYLRASVSRTRLAADPYISANAQFDFPSREPTAYWRFHARFVANTARPHHWVRVGAGNAAWGLDGLANTKPTGDQGFWFDLDARDGDIFAFYVYWHQMRSGRCNDGSATPGCAGDQGTTYFYGNNFVPANQTPFPRDQWFCVEIMTHANTLGQKDGALAFYVNDELVGDYRTGVPASGRWLRDNFYTWGQYYRDEGPFEGFDFRTSNDVAVKRVTLDAYYEKGTLDRMIADGQDIPETQRILYDDVVVATERIGCKVPRP